MGRYSLLDLSTFQGLLFYQLTSSFYYFDILAMKDDELAEFYVAEVEHFAEAIANKTLRRTAMAAARCETVNANVLPSEARSESPGRA